MKKYIRVVGKWGTIILTMTEYARGLDRENYGVVGEIIKEKDYDLLGDEEFRGVFNLKKRIKKVRIK